MTIYVSRSWPSHHPDSFRRPGTHPHSVGRGAGNYYTYPDEMWAAAKEIHTSLEEVPGSEVRFEWARGYPDGYALLEGAVCSLGDRPQAFLPALQVTRHAPRRVIELGLPSEPVEVRTNAA